MNRSLLVGLVAVVACGKTVPLATSDATSDAPPNDPRCPTLLYDGQPCSTEGLTCDYPASCGVDVSTCSGGMWSTIRCDGAKHCPCLSQTDCDTGGQCGADGVCQASNAPSCGGVGMPCCGGTCGSCGAGLVCSAGVCEMPSSGGTLGAACTLQCDGTSNCDPGQYCPDSCLQCPCTDTCHAQASICTLGTDQTCNDNPMTIAIQGHCVAGQGPFATTCTCLAGFTNDPLTGRCM